MSRLRVLLVDDSRLARSELRTLLAAHPEVEVVGEADDVDSAVSACEALAPDLLLLDIQLPQGSGFDVLERLLSPPAVVFCTAYDAHAVRAFERNALDYLLKPVEPERLKQALQRALDARGEAEAQRSVLGADDPVFLRDGERCWFVAAGEISHVEMDGNYATVHFRGQHALLTRSLASLESRLDPALFFRASRGALVNLRHVVRVDPAVGEGYTLTLRCGAEVEVSRRQARAFRERLAL
ncbi:LytR/AlgR family response regulator transcription factor [Pseudomarimonas salicorniae]|uniref:LytTR family DNA-binding domain-containing protein n=1 Tax=Pseudomarimonas salicorniae TaxID=2933270 RepID=A0ABT0GLV0_9GAMM|nr:LytTR family DNA-binding domain-containing protein [Lysobacter sp. CAU 1642]MCK7595519.1 LytTR family DNA-binding domain-containing protein [Lysobacter sp. CAU 1642]